MDLSEVSIEQLETFAANARKVAEEAGIDPAEVGSACAGWISTGPIPNEDLIPDAELERAAKQYARETAAATD